MPLKKKYWSNQLAIYTGHLLCTWSVLGAWCVENMLLSLLIGLQRSRETDIHHRCCLQYWAVWFHPTCCGLCFLGPGSQSGSFHVLNILGSKVMPECILFTICSTQLNPKLYLLKVTNQPGFPRNEGVPRMWDLLVLKLGNSQSNQDVLVTLLLALPVAVFFSLLWRY